MAAKKLSAAELSARDARARAKTLSLGERRAMVKLPFAQRRAKLNPAASINEDGVPKATHLGELRLGDVVIPCAVLSDGTRVLSHRGIGLVLGRKFGGRDWNGVGEGSAGKLPWFMGAKNLKPYICAELEVLGNRPLVYSQQGGMAYGLPARVLTLLCTAWVRAGNAGVLRANQMHIAQQASILLGAFADVGINALIDEATGYQDDRPANALSEILEAFIANELRPWVKTFPRDFYREIYRLKVWPYDPDCSARPQAVGQITNDLVYHRLAPGLLEELNAATPRDDKGRLLVHLHRQLSEHVGHTKLREHIGLLLFLMRANLTWDGFKRQLDRSLPRFGKNYELPLGEDWAP